MDERVRSQRLFFALWPDEITRRALALLQRSIVPHRGKPVAVPNLHITLVFIGNVDGALKACVQDRAERVGFEPFNLIMTRLGHFRRARVTWVGPETCPLPLISLVEQLNTALETCGYRPDNRPFSAHLTLFRKAGPVRPVTEIAHLHWHIDRFCLVQSNTLQQGPEYRVLRYYTSSPAGGDRRGESK